MTQQSAITYPLKMNFKLVALAPRVFVRDAMGNLLLYVHQKTFKLKEDIRIYQDEQKTNQLFAINADRILDFNANYSITHVDGRQIGTMKHKGLRSIWNSHWNLMNPSGQQNFVITEDNAWVKILDSIANEISIIGMFTGYFFNPSYTVYRGDDEKTGQPVMRLKKEPSFFESSFTISRLEGELSRDEEMQVILGLLLMVQMERSRG